MCVSVQMSFAGDEASSKPMRIELKFARYIALPVVQFAPIEGSPPLNELLAGGT